MLSKIHIYPGPQSVTIFGNRVFADAVVKVQSYWRRVALNPVTGVLGKSGVDTETQGEAA